MARTNPHHDWTEPQAGAQTSSGAQWESLRNELVALLDQVEDHVGVTAPIQNPDEAPNAPPAPSQPVPTRHSEALKSVRQAVSRLAERSEEKPVIRESVIDAINQIRARQTGTPVPPAPTPDPSAAPSAGPAGETEISGLANSLDALGERIGAFESQIGSRLDTLDSRPDISGQIGQLSDVIEMLASAVGETGQIRRIEAQIGNLAEILANDRAADANLTAKRLEDLAGAVEKLVTHQIETADRDSQLAAQAENRQSHAMGAIEHSVRSIYDRIDALEASKAEPAYVERLSNDMAALTEAMSANREPQALLDEIDALSQRIETMQAPSQTEGETLAHSVSVLRAVIADTIEPRFEALEGRLESLSGDQNAGGSGAIEDQLRLIGRRVEETSAQLKALAELPEGARAIAPDFDMLAERIAERANALSLASGPTGDGIDKADLEALEDRLASLFARSQPADLAVDAHLDGVKSSIAQVDNRIARLEAMLNTRTQAVAEAVEDVAAAPLVPRSKPADTMPVDPATGQAPETEALAIDVDLSDAVPKPFTIDPELVERPVKPQSSFAQARENPFEAPQDDFSPAAGGISNATRSSFIEAARRSARQPEPDEVESKSLIGRALARFQRSEAEAETPTAISDTPVAPEQTDPVASVEPDYDAEQEAEPQPGFLARNRRALLLGTALVAAIALAVPLILDRMTQSAPATAQIVAPEAVTESTAASETDDAVLPGLEPIAADEPAPASVEDLPQTIDTSSLTSGVRVIEQQAGLTAARVDGASITAAPYIDPIQTAAIRADGPVADSAPANAAAITSAALPQITVPEAIEPAELRAAAEAGDRYAQFEVGAVLTEGTLVEQDFAAASAWYERSAAQGFAPAQYRLGSLYESGRGVERDLEMARLWYQRAAEAGNRMSMHNLASLYAGGELEAQDFASAAHWFDQAAERGMTDSQFNLGMLHARGLGVEQDFEQSYLWFSLAARAGDQDAANSRDDVARSLDAATVQRLDETIGNWAPEPFELAANFAPIGTWDESFDPGPAIGNTDVVLRVQMLLSKLGFEVGTPDGIAGPRTREAIASFERETGMSESGAINPRLLAVLGSQPV